MSKFLCLLVFLSVLYCSSKCDPIPDNKHELFTQAMDKMESTFQHYNRDLDHTIPWKTLKSSLSSINLQYDFHSPNATDFLKTIREKVSSGSHQYFQSASIMYEWATFASTALTIYLEIIDSDNYNGTDLIIDVLDQGIKKMNETIPLLEGVYGEFSDASNNLELLSQEFNVTKLHMDGEYLNKELKIRVRGYLGGVASSAVVGLMSSVLTDVFCPTCDEEIKALVGLGAAALGTLTSTAVIEAKFIQDVENLIEDIQEYYDSTSKAMENVSENIDKTIVEIKSEINRLHALKANAELTNNLIMRDFVVIAIKSSVKKLIDVCNEYIAFHK